jgi:hypothetical protein
MRSNIPRRKGCLIPFFGSAVSLLETAFENVCAGQRDVVENEESAACIRIDAEIDAAEEVGTGGVDEGWF